VLSILNDLQPLTGNGRYVFPSELRQGGHVSDMTINKALKLMGYNTSETHCTHGFRSSARTMLDEVLGFVEWIEQQLSHAVKDSLGRAYNRTKHLEQRKDMMQKWADYLDVLKVQTSGGNIIAGTFNKKA
jgi:integrase